MSFFRKVFSSDYRAAVAAEAAGNVDVAAERYALAGEYAAAVRMHLARAARAGSRTAELGALRDAMRWAGEDPELRKQAAAALGKGLYAAVKAEGIATERDRQKVREAAEMLVLGDDHAAAGDALEAIGDHLAAANAYSAGGFVERMEAALAKDDELQEKAREEKDAFASYETHMRVGRRDDARADLARAARARRERADGVPPAARRARHRAPDRRQGRAAAPRQADHHRVRGGEDRARARPAVRPDAARGRRLAAARGGGPRRRRVPAARSRLAQRHERERAAARRARAAGGDRQVRARRRVHDRVRDRRRDAAPARRGRARSRRRADRRRRHLDLAPLGLGLDLVFQRGRPLLGKTAAREVSFNDEPLGDVRIQIVRGDRILADGDEIDVA